MGTAVAIGRIGHDAAAGPWHLAAGQEIDTGRAEAAVGDIGGDHFVAVRREHGGHRAIAAAGLPYRAAQPDVPQQRLGNPGRRGIEVSTRAVVARHMDGTVLHQPGRFHARPACGRRIELGKRQAELGSAHPCGALSKRLRVVVAMA